MGSDTRVDAILFGCLLALWKNPWLDAVPPANAQRDACLIAAAGATLLFTLLYRDELFRSTLRYSLQSMAVAVLIYLAVARAQHWSFRWLSAKPLAYLGSISYTVYLSHHVVLLAIEKHRPEWNWMTATAIAMVVTLAIAEPMRRWVEEPCARLRRRLHKRPAEAPVAQPYAVSPNTSTGAL
jgi:peptidoglycan/LPS O-acetylase OafA/YrhL